MTNIDSTPAALGFRMPAEWEPQEAIWLSWPHRQKTWPGAFEPVPAVFAEIARQISEFQLVRINVADAAMAASVQQILESAQVNLKNVRFHFNPTNDAWVRDHGPIYVVRDLEDGRRQRAITNWIFNAWGGKYPPFDSDNAIPSRIAEEFHEHRFDAKIILEGGSIDVNGAGSLLTTRCCLLNKNRNPQCTVAEIENHLRENLGLTQILWLGEGIVGDDTDGHVDDLTRFVAPNIIVTAVESDPSDVNYKALYENLETLKSFVNPEGKPFEIVPLPMPDPVLSGEQRLPASYSNFLICNDKVLVPTYRSIHDSRALGLLQDLFPTRKVVGIDCPALVFGLGSIHCVTQQQPLGETFSYPTK